MKHFTGQEVVLKSRHEDFVICPCCNELVGLKTAYFDRFKLGGMQVHFKCLSQQRRTEIAAEEAAK